MIIRFRQPYENLKQAIFLAAHNLKYFSYTYMVIYYFFYPDFGKKDGYDFIKLQRPKHTHWKALTIHTN